VIVNLYATRHRCWKCQGLLNYLSQPVSGWRYHCPHCQHLTSPESELRHAMQAKPEQAAGIVAAVACRLDIQAPEPAGAQ
jgi:hypothetical protein